MIVILAPQQEWLQPSRRCNQSIGSFVKLLTSLQ